MKKLFTESDHSFQPFEYGLYLPREDTHPVRGFPARDAYAKQTGLWVGGGFHMPTKRAVKKKKFSVKDVASDNRSYTPRGFARAVVLRFQEQHAGAVSSSS